MRFRPDAAGVVTVTALAFFAPAAVLAAASPIVVKLQLRSLGETGTVVGRLSALGTAGAILGTFVTGFVLVAALPTRPIVIGVGLLPHPRGRPHRRDARPGARPLDRGPRARGRRTRDRLDDHRPRALRAGERLLLHQRRDRTPATPQGVELRMDTLRHAYIDLADPTWLEFAYTRLFGDVIDGFAPPGEPIDALHIGGGGFTMPRYIEATRPGSYSRVLELDPVVLQTAREELGLVTSDALEVVVGDGRVSLAAEPSDGL